MAKHANHHGPSSDSIDNLKNALFVFPPQACFQIFHDDEAKYHFQGPYNLKGKCRKDFYLTKGLRYTTVL